MKLETTPEIGKISWITDIDTALSTAKQTDKPILLVFQEVPGCSTCVNFGKQVLSDPKLIDITAKYFIPCLVNNRGSSVSDRTALARYQEPMLNNPVTRFLYPNGIDIIPRKAGVYSLGEILERAQCSLDKWREIKGEAQVNSEHKRANSSVMKKSKLVLSMACFWEGEGAINHFASALPGMISTQAAWYGTNEVVKVTYDENEFPLQKFIAQCYKANVFTRVYVESSAQREVVSEVVKNKKAVKKFISSFLISAKLSDQKKYCRGDCKGMSEKEMMRLNGEQWALMRGM